jgi:hypothetical protein
MKAIVRPFFPPRPPDARPEQKEALKAAIVEGLAPYRTPDGGYRLDNEYHYLIARA